MLCFDRCTAFRLKKVTSPARSSRKEVYCTTVKFLYQCETFIVFHLFAFTWMKMIETQQSRKRCIYPPYIMGEVSFSLCNAKVGTVSKKSHE